MMNTIANPTIVPIKVARTRRTTQIVASIRRLCASRYIQSPPSSRGDDADRTEGEDDEDPPRHHGRLQGLEHPMPPRRQPRLAISWLSGHAGGRQAFESGIFRVVASVFAPLTGVLLTLSLNPQCSHSIQIRTDR